MKVNDDWDNLKKTISGITNTPEQIVEFLAVEDIVILCAEGLSIDTIARFKDFDEIYVEDVIKTFLEFRGWELDLDINPLLVYNRVNSQEEFTKEVKSISSVMLDTDIVCSWIICEKYTYIRKVIESYYGN